MVIKIETNISKLKPVSQDQVLSRIGRKTKTASQDKITYFIKKEISVICDVSCLI